MNDQIQNPGAQPGVRYLEDLSWLVELAMLLSRRSDFGIGADVEVMRLDELHGLFCFLARKEETAVCDE